MSDTGKILFVDIETVTQKQYFTELDTEWQHLWEKQADQSYACLNLTPAESYLAKGALHAEFSKIICMCLAYFKYDPHPTLMVKKLTGDEKDILKFFSAPTPFQKLCAHNGKKFDFPFISRRLLLNGMKLPPILDMRGKKPWEIENLDTQEMWRFGDMVYPSADLLCKSFGLPVKLGLDGSMVHDTYYVQKDMQKIVDYCAADVISVAKLYVKLVAPALSVETVQVVE